MADTVYRVLTVYEADTKGAQQAAGNLIITFDSLINLMGRAKGMISYIFDLQSAAEGSRIAIAGLLSAADMPGTKNFQNALQMSSDIIVKMRKDARDLPGTFEDLQEIFSQSILGAGAAGKSTNQAEQMSANVMAVTKALNIPAEQAGREFAMLMEGRAGAHNPLFQKLKGAMDPGMTGAKFNAMGEPERWAQIEKALGKFGPMIAEYSKGWEAARSTTEDYAKDLTRLATNAFFESMKSTLKDLNSWFDANRPQLEAFAKSFGEQLADGFRTVKDVFAFVLEHRDVFMKLAEALVVGKLTGIAGLGKGGIGGRMLGGAAGGAALAELTNTNKNSGAFGEAMEPVRVAFGGLLGAMAPLPGKFGEVATGLSALYQVLNLAAGMLDDLHSKDVIAEGDTQAMKDLLLKSNRNAFVAEDRMLLLANTAGAITAKGGFDSGKFKEYLYGPMMRAGATFDYNEITKMTARMGKAMGHFSPEDIARRFDKPLMGPLAKPPGWKDPEDEKNKPATKPPPQMNVAIKIEQTVNTEGDPDRLLIVTKKAIRESLERPLMTFHNNIL